MSNNNFGIDLGTSQIKIYNQKRGTTLIEKNMVAVRHRHQLLAIGDEAFEMFEKNPPSIDVGGSVREGSLSDIDRVEVLLHLLLMKSEPHIGISPNLFFSAPTNRSGLEERAYYAISNAGNLKNPRVYVIDRAICDSIALGIPLSRTEGSLIINIGAQNTDVSVIAREQVIISKSIPIGGQQMNGAICDELRRTDNVLIGHRTARRLKAVLANFDEKKSEARRVIGLDTLSGLPRECIVTSDTVNRAIRTQMAAITDEINAFLERTPPQIVQSVRAEGLYLTGGTTQIPGIEKYFAKACQCRINLSSYYDRCTIRGLEEIITHKALHKWAKNIKDRL